jgi:hypothetical protein
MSCFLTVEDVRRGRKVVLGGKIVTAIDLSGAKVLIAEDGQWHPHDSVHPLTEEQLRDERIQEMSRLVEGKQIVTLLRKGKGVQFVLEDNTRVGLDYASKEDLTLSIVDPDGTRIL